MTEAMGPRSILTRPARPDDLTSLHRLEVECVGGSALPLSQFRWLLESQGPDPAFILRVAHDWGSEREPIGFTVWRRRPDPVAPSYEILDLSVGKLFREERVEHALLSEIVESGTREGIVGISVNVPVANLAAAAFYLSHAFKPDHRVERYYSDGSAMEVFVKRLK
jgi:ribosomal protein S18 acetylase RimI-like enzyme